MSRQQKSGNSNSNLHSAKSAKNDEFYTQLSDIENELRHYTDQLRGKTIFCNCDDPAESNFFLYFLLKFKDLKLKRLMTTHYVAEGSSYQIEVRHAEMAKIISNTIRHGYDFNSQFNINALQSLEVITPLQENGDFRSPECIELLKQADVVVTNPPFSLFREYVALLDQYRKMFVIIGNKNAITYKETFKLIKENKMWVGMTPMGTDILFDLPVDFANELRTNKQEGSAYKIVNGIVKGRSQAVWFTNLDITKRHEELTLYKQYSPKEYPSYDNYDAIEVSKTAEIPMDYGGVMGVPITFLDKYNPTQFEIIGSADDRDFYPIVFGKYEGRITIQGKQPFKRILIRLKTKKPQ